METHRWVRAENGAIFGVCKGLGESMDLPVGVIRLLLVISILFAGFGLGLYILLAIALPRRDRLDKAYKARILGVCAYIARRSHIEVGLVRFIALILLFASFGLTVLAYVIAYMLLPEEEKSSDSRSKPSVPPSTT